MPYKELKDLPQDEWFAPGHGLCAGCTAALTARLIAKVSGPKTVVVSATGCIEVSTTPYPYTAWKIPWLHVAFENAAAAASGIRAAYDALRAKGIISEDVNVVALAGDGGTADIGFQALSGAFERGDRITFVCYDNEAYMNTGIQRSGTTPYGASTTTSPHGKACLGQTTWKKDLVAIALAHRVPYVATATPGYLVDEANKIEKALNCGGPAFLHILQPCPAGWGTDSSMGIRISRLAVTTGLWPLYEYNNGELRVTVRVPQRVHVQKYIDVQSRFKHLLHKPEELAKIQAYADALAEKYKLGPVVSSE
ncbi:MAG: thiamine pyrophosphate-dependent enzyme [Candidatus Bathyarchaeia archaeon]